MRLTSSLGSTSYGFFSVFIVNASSVLIHVHNALIQGEIIENSTECVDNKRRPFNKKIKPAIFETWESARPIFYVVPLFQDTVKGEEVMIKF